MRHLHKTISDGGDGGGRDSFHVKHLAWETKNKIQLKNNLK